MTALLPPPPPPTVVPNGRAGETVSPDNDNDYEFLLLSHIPMVTAVCRRRLGRRPEVEDAAQETMLRALRSGQQLRDPERLGPWLARIADRVCIDVLRAESKRELVVEYDEVEDPHHPEEIALQKDEARRVHQLLGSLSDRHRQAIWMRDAMGDPVDEVADALGMTNGSARVLLTRARTQLRQAWGGVPMIWLARLQWRLAKFRTELDMLAPSLAPAVVAVAAVTVLAPAPAVARAMTETVAPPAPTVTVDGVSTPLTGAVAPAATEAAPVAAGAPAVSATSAVAAPQAAVAPQVDRSITDTQVHLEEDPPPDAAPNTSLDTGTTETKRGGDAPLEVDVYAGVVPEQGQSSVIDLSN